MGVHYYILDYISISVYVLNRTLHDIHDDFGAFFTSAPVHSVLYYMLTLIHQQHLVVDGAVLCVLFQMSSLITYFIDPLFSSFSFLQLVFITSYLIIIYVSLVIVSLLALCRLSLLASASLLSLILFLFQYSQRCVSLLGCLVCRFLSSCSCVAAQLDFILLDAHSVVCRCLVISCVGLGSLLLFSSLRGLLHLCSITQRLFWSWCSWRRLLLLDRLMCWIWILCRFSARSVTFFV